MDRPPSGHAPLRLPVLKHLPLGKEPDLVLGALQRLVDDGAAKQGYVRVETGAASHFLFLLNGTCFSAGTVQDDRLGAASLRDFFRTLELRRDATWCVTDLPLFLCTAVLFRKAPAAQLPSKLVDSGALLAQLQDAGKDAVLVIRKDNARSLAFCQAGEPAALYPAPGEKFPDSGSVADRIMEYVYADTDKARLILDLYDEIRLPPATSGGQRLERYREAAANAGPEPSLALVVRLGERVVFTYPVLSDVLTIGRGGHNDLALDNLSVSRNHARVTCRGASLIFEDQGSENRLAVGGAKTTRAVLQVGESLDIGKYTLTVRQLTAWEPQPEVRRDGAAVAPVDETIALPAESFEARLEHGGQALRLTGHIFTIGKRPGVNLQVRGLFIAPLHAQIERDRQGAYFVRHVDGRSAVKVNGAKVERQQLRDGDEIAVAGERLLFRLGR